MFHFHSLKQGFKLRNKSKTTRCYRPFLSENCYTLFLKLVL